MKNVRPPPSKPLDPKLLWKDSNESNLKSRAQLGNNLKAFKEIRNNFQVRSDETHKSYNGYNE